MTANAVEQPFFDELADDSRIVCRPFVKWVGGKSQLIAPLIQRVPTDFKRYFEPFVGGGALMFKTQPKNAYISDINSELINAYQIVKEDVKSLIKDLRKHVYDKDYFYKVRNLDRSLDYKRLSPVQRASRLIFLNKTCYNGLYRVNSSGQFNTPFGRYTDPTIVDEVNLRACSKVLAGTTINLSSFLDIEPIISRDDFVYFDPPYVPLSSTANFTTYSRQGFDQKMQISLFEMCCSLDRKGARFMLSNSSAQFVRRLYKKFNINLVSAARSINSNGAKRGQINEVIVTNY
jgi:DNA adenine methylase